MHTYGVWQMYFFVTQCNNLFQCLSTSCLSFAICVLQNDQLLIYVLFPVTGYLKIVNFMSIFGLMLLFSWPIFRKYRTWHIKLLIESLEIIDLPYAHEQTAVALFHFSLVCLWSIQEDGKFMQAVYLVNLPSIQKAI